MKLIDSYTPQYVLRLQQTAGDCDCPSCRQRPSLVTLSWQQQIRRSALAGCDRAAREIFCRDDAFVLHEDASPQLADAAPFDPRQQALNQAAINLAVVPEAAIEPILYALGVLISKSRRLAEPQQITALGDELIGLLQQGEMANALADLPVIDSYKLAALRALSRADLDASLDPLVGMSLVLKMNEINVLNERYLREMLNELEHDEQLTALAQSPRGPFRNLLLYVFYHHAFPGADDAGWELQFHRLCYHYFSVKMLCALFLHNDLPLGEETIAALFAAWQRLSSAEPQQTLQETAGDNPLLAGLALLR